MSARRDFNPNEMNMQSALDSDDPGPEYQPEWERRLTSGELDEDEYCPPDCQWCAAIDAFCKGEGQDETRRLTGEVQS